MTYFMFLYKFADQAVILFLKWRGSARLVLMRGLYKNRGQFSNDSFCLRVQQVRILLERKNSSSCLSIFLFCTTYYNCVSNKMPEYDMLLTALIIIYGLIGCFRSKLNGLTTLITNFYNWTGQIGQLSSHKN